MMKDSLRSLIAKLQGHRTNTVSREVRYVFDVILQGEVKILVLESIAEDPCASDKQTNHCCLLDEEANTHCQGVSVFQLTQYLDIVEEVHVVLQEEAGKVRGRTNNRVGQCGRPSAMVRHLVCPVDPWLDFPRCAFSCGRNFLTPAEQLDPRTLLPDSADMLWPPKHVLDFSTVLKMPIIAPLRSSFEIRVNITLINPR